MVTDYLGNEIKAGDKVCFITVIEKQYYRGGYLIPASLSKSGKPEQYLEPKIPDNPCWKVGKYITIEPGMKYTIISGEYELTTPFPPMFWEDNGTSIIAIKGKSDTYKQYQEYLKKN